MRHTSAFPIKCVVCSHSLNITTGLAYSSNNSGGVLSLSDRVPVALDCEMVGVGPKKINALGRVSIVDYFGNVLYDVMVRPEEEITDYRTKWSGIRPNDMRRAIPFGCAQEQVKRIIHNRTVVGHMIHNDFAVLDLIPPKQLVRDTARAPYAKLVAGFPVNRVVGLRALTIRLFGIHIQDGEHCSVEDARATMAIYRLVQDDWEADLASQSKSFQTKGCKLRQRLAAFDPVVSSQIPTKFRRFTSDSVVNFIPSVVQELELEHKRPSLSVTTYASSASLLDDEFWPDCLDEGTG